MTELNMSTFIREMGSLMDQHELGGTLNDILNEEYVMVGGAAGQGSRSSIGNANNSSNGRGRNDEEGGGSTGGSIRRQKQ